MNNFYQNRYEEPNDNTTRSGNKYGLRPEMMVRTKKYTSHCGGGVVVTSQPLNMEMEHGSEHANSLARPPQSKVNNQIFSQNLIDARSNTSCKALYVQVFFFGLGSQCRINHYLLDGRGARFNAVSESGGRG